MTIEDPKGMMKHTVLALLLVISGVSAAYTPTRSVERWCYTRTDGTGMEVYFVMDEAEVESLTITVFKYGEPQQVSISRRRDLLPDGTVGLGSGLWLTVSETDGSRTAIIRYEEHGTSSSLETSLTAAVDWITWAEITGLYQTGIRAPIGLEDLLQKPAITYLPAEL